MYSDISDKYATICEDEITLKVKLIFQWEWSSMNKIYEFCKRINYNRLRKIICFRLLGLSE